MTTAYWCVLAAALMPYVAVSIAKSGGERFDRPENLHGARSAHRMQRRARQE